MKDVAGFTLKDLFVGSEGCLGVVTKITLKLIPRPAAKKTMLATFDSMTAAASTISEIIESKIIPCTLEFLDSTTIRCVEQFAKIGLPLDVASLLLMEVDGPRRRSRGTGCCDCRHCAGSRSPRGQVGAQ